MAIKFYMIVVLSLILCLNAYGQGQTPTLPTPETLIQKINAQAFSADAPILLTPAQKSPAKKLFVGTNLISANLHYNDSPTNINGTVIKDADVLPDFATEYRFFLGRQIDKSLAVSAYLGRYNAKVAEGRNITDLQWLSGGAVITRSKMSADALGILLHKQFKIFGKKQNKRFYGNLGYRRETRTANIKLYDRNVLIRDGEVTQNLTGIEAEAGVNFTLKNGTFNLGYIMSSSISGLNISYGIMF